MSEENNKYFIEQQGPYLDSGKWYIKKYFYLDEALSGTPLKSEIEEVDAPTIVNKYTISLKNFLSGWVGTCKKLHKNPLICSRKACNLGR